MKTIFGTLIVITLLGYISCSLYFTTWNPMEYSENGRFTFDCFMVMGLIMGGMIRALDLDKPIHNDHQEYLKQNKRTW